MQTSTASVLTRVRSKSRCLLLCAAAAIGGCEPTVDTRGFLVDVLVESDADVPLAGARVLRDNQEQGQSAADGKVRLTLEGREGDSLTLRVACSEEYASPEAPITVALRSLAGAAVPRYKALCTPLVRNLVVAVRAQQGPNLPVTYRGREVARTDPSGAAHVLLKVPPKDEVSLALDVSAEPWLRPRTADMTFQMPAKDKIVVFDTTFTREQPVEKKPPRVAKRLGPTPVQSSAR
jgi:hypothetical protein